MDPSLLLRIHTALTAELVAMKTSPFVVTIDCSHFFPERAVFRVLAWSLIQLLMFAHLHETPV